MLSFSEKILFIICVIGSLAYAYFDFKNVYQLIQRGSGRKPTWAEMKTRAIEALKTWLTLEPT